MAKPATPFTITCDNNVSLVTTSIADQFGQIMKHVVDAFVSAGWTVSRSSNGTTASSANNITSDTSFILGTAGNGGWVAMQSPIGMLDNSERWSVLIYANNATYGQCLAKATTGTYSGGSTSSLPTASAAETSNISSHYVTVGTTTVTAGYFNANIFSNGGVSLFVKPVGDTTTGSVNSWMADFLGFQDANHGALGHNARWCFGWDRFTSLSSYNDWRTMNTTGDTSYTCNHESIIDELCNSKSDGLHFDGAVPWDYIHYGVDSSSYMRKLGYDGYQMIRAPSGLDYGTLLDEQSSDANRCYSVGYSRFWWYKPADDPTGIL